ncbi:hypothetical protein AN219_37550 [Streptomyces nanshensis]|nr:hypothetical protein AN219_37550 [Streptomyces nanshensis]
MYGISPLRRLPWDTPSGNACYLSTDNPYGLLSTMADEVEAEMLRDGTKVLNGAKAVISDPKAGEEALRRALKSATEALHDVLRVAESRGTQLSLPEGAIELAEDDGGADGPELPAESFG